MAFSCFWRAALGPRKLRIKADGRLNQEPADRSFDRTPRALTSQETKVYRAVRLKILNDAKQRVIERPDINRGNEIKDISTDEVAGIVAQKLPRCGVLIKDLTRLVDRENRVGDAVQEGLQPD